MAYQIDLRMDPSSSTIRLGHNLPNKFGSQNNFNKKIDELNQETETLIDEIEKWQT